MGLSLYHPTSYVTFRFCGPPNFKKKKKKMKALNFSVRPPLIPCCSAPPRSAHHSHVGPMRVGSSRDYSASLCPPPFSLLAPLLSGGPFRRIRPCVPPPPSVAHLGGEGLFTPFTITRATRPPPPAPLKPRPHHNPAARSP